MANLLLILTVSIVALNITASMQIDSIKHEWKLFKEKFSKSFANPVEDKSRFNIFAENMMAIEEHNRQFEEGKVSFRMAVNKFTDMTFEEFISVNGGYTANSKRTLTRVKHTRNGKKEKYDGEHTRKQLPKQVKEDDDDSNEETEIPESIDWRTKGVVTSVKNQKRCGSCWAFSAVGAIEGQAALKTFILEELSPQHLIDCAWSSGNMGCWGGRMDWAFDYVMDNNGIATESYYPYEGINGMCRYIEHFLGSDVIGYVTYGGGYEDWLQEDVGKIGPISITFNVQPSFKQYSEGIYYEADCNPNNLNHGMLAVGYGTTEEGEDYWIVKNSWSEDWGEQGYVRVARNRNNTCGIASDYTYPLI